MVEYIVCHNNTSWPFGYFKGGRNILSKQFVNSFYTAFFSNVTHSGTRVNTNSFSFVTNKMADKISIVTTNLYYKSFCIEFTFNSIGIFIPVIASSFTVTRCITIAIQIVTIFCVTDIT